MNAIVGSNALKKAKIKTAMVGWIFVAPALLCAAVLRYYPLLSAFYLSFFEYDYINPPGVFIGIKNYLQIIHEDFFIQALGNTFVYLILAILLTFFVPVIQAIFLNELIKGRKVFSTIYLITAIIPISVNVVIWKWIWNPSYGLANSVLKFFGIQSMTWLSDPNLTKFCIVFPGILGGGTAVLLYLAAILSIPGEIVESAYIDGCSGWKRIIHIILPNIKFIVLIQLVYLVINTMQIYDVPYQYTSGGPAGASTSVGLYIFRVFRDDTLVGKSNAAAFVLFIVVAIIVFIQLKLDKTEID